MICFFCGIVTKYAALDELGFSGEIVEHYMCCENCFDAYLKLKKI